MLLHMSLTGSALVTHRWRKQHCRQDVSEAARHLEDVVNARSSPDRHAQPAPEGVRAPLGHEQLTLGTAAESTRVDATFFCTCECLNVRPPLRGLHVLPPALQRQRLTLPQALRTLLCT
eukprot:TRINITY_DN6586_c0_g1_i2.p1 TRINITY_DN6586_c0_g1~~TRINITY_DN6586_c0_g1_i2.p1  ORF type:complete len:119 (+),score=12.48 TRINITY_DN6586_c0_g1_i2:410-766(+)